MNEVTLDEVYVILENISKKFETVNDTSVFDEIINSVNNVTTLLTVVILAFGLLLGAVLFQHFRK